MPIDRRKTCFIIMPFGKKPDLDGNDIDFDLVYRDVFVEPVEALGFTAVRCDEIVGPGSIHRDMFTHIAMDDLAIVDITTGNPNVFYELGVRHALKPAMTILMKRRGAPVPFNINGQRIIEYPAENGSYSQSREELRSYIERGPSAEVPDSPIFSVLQDARKDWKRERISQLQRFRYRLDGSRAREICLITGDIRDWRGIDVWVNSENTNMQMARFYDQSLSAVIRYEGAVKDENGEVVEDSIADELRVRVGNREAVTPGTVYVTGSGALAANRLVKKVFHAATVQGVPGGGYRVIPDVEKCVAACLSRMDHERYRDEGLTSIVFPMMGTGVAGGQVEAIAPRLMRSVVSYFYLNPDSLVETVYFSAWNHRDLEACQTALQRLEEIKPIDH